jgi:hypothetical protein
MRAISVENSRATRVEHNLAEHCDTGAVVEREAAGARVHDNWFHDCRVGVLCWDDVSTTVDANAISAARDHAVVANTAVELRDNDLGGGDVWTAP